MKGRGKGKGQGKGRGRGKGGRASGAAQPGPSAPRHPPPPAPPAPTAAEQRTTAATQSAAAALGGAECAEVLECLQRQLDELECVEALFCEPGELLLDDLPPERLAALRALHAAYEGGERTAEGAAAELERVPPSRLGFRLRMGLAVDAANSSSSSSSSSSSNPEGAGIIPPLVVHIALPRLYPTVEMPAFVVHHPTLPRLEVELAAAGAELAAARRGQECVTELALLVQQLFCEGCERELAERRQRARLREEAAGAAATAAALEEDEHQRAAVEAVQALQLADALEASAVAPTLGRRLLFSHHIINPNKRKVVVEWALQLGLGGLSKIGWPGVIVVEGPESGCQEYVSRLQHLRWKYLVVRGEMVERGAPGTDLDALRKLPRGFQELGQDGMSELARRCREAGLEQLFLTSMKIYGGAKKGDGGDGDSDDEQGGATGAGGSSKKKGRSGGHAKKGSKKR